MLWDLFISYLNPILPEKDKHVGLLCVVQIYIENHFSVNYIYKLAYPSDVRNETLCWFLFSVYRLNWIFKGGLHWFICKIQPVKNNIMFSVALERMFQTVKKTPDDVIMGISVIKDKEKK